MDETNQQFDSVGKLPSYKRIELIFANFAEQIGGTYSVKAGLDDRDANGFQSDFSIWFKDHFINPITAKNTASKEHHETPSLTTLFEYAYVKYKFRTWEIEFRTMLSKTQSCDTVQVWVSCPIHMKKGIHLELWRDPNNSKMPEKNEPFAIPKWLGIFFPNRLIKSRGNQLGATNILYIHDAVLQNSFVASCNDRGIGEKVVQDPRFQECLKNSTHFEYLEIGYSDWIETSDHQILEIRSSTGVALGSQPLLEALELAKTSLTLLEEFELISKDAEDNN